MGLDGDLMFKVTLMIMLMRMDLMLVTAAVNVSHLRHIRFLHSTAQLVMYLTMTRSGMMSLDFLVNIT